MPYIDIQEKIIIDTFLGLRERDTEIAIYEDMEYFGHKATMTYYYFDYALAFFHWDGSTDSRENIH